MENNQRPGAVQLDDTRQFWLNWITNLQQTDAAGPEGYQYLADVLNGCEPLTIAAKFHDKLAVPPAVSEQS